jgi:hypothetical protein
MQSRLLPESLRTAAKSSSSHSRSLRRPLIPELVAYEWPRALTCSVWRISGLTSSSVTQPPDSVPPEPHLVEHQHVARAVIYR